MPSLLRYNNIEISSVTILTNPLPLGSRADPYLQWVHKEIQPRSHPRQPEFLFDSTKACSATETRVNPSRFAFHLRPTLPIPSEGIGRTVHSALPCSFQKSVQLRHGYHFEPPSKIPWREITLDLRLAIFRRLDYKQK